MNSKFIYRSVGFLFLGFLLVLGGCASVQEAGVTKGAVAIPAGVAKNEKNTYHKVHRGETLWRISKLYQISIDEIIKANNIPNGAHLEENQLILIPGAKETLEMPAEDKEDPRKEEFAWPMKGRLADYYGDRRGNYINRGIGIEAKEGETVAASRQGKVVFADYLTGYDQTVMIDHLDGYISVYSNNDKLLVKLGDTIYKGDPIALAGKKGNGSYLHFEIRKNAIADNPMYYLPKL